ncbi:hypothetical protein HHI36_000538, partial [Cryptolaemus montrouzieri]
STTTDDKKIGSTTPDVVKLAVKRQRPKAASPNRQGPQQCQALYGKNLIPAKIQIAYFKEYLICTQNVELLIERSRSPTENQ